MRDRVKEQYKAMVFIAVVVTQLLGYTMQILKTRSMLPVLEVGLGMGPPARTGQ